VCPSFLSYISLLFKQCYTLDSLPWFLIPKSPFRFKKTLDDPWHVQWSIPTQVTQIKELSIHRLKSSPDDRRSYVHA
jgi:hypothetical protein